MLCCFISRMSWSIVGLIERPAGLRMELVAIDPAEQDASTVHRDHAVDDLHRGTRS